MPEGNGCITDREPVDHKKPGELKREKGQQSIIQGGAEMDKNSRNNRALAWVLTFIIVALALYITESAWCLWALLIPMLEV